LKFKPIKESYTQLVETTLLTLTHWYVVDVA